ncbi:hypothetical protein O5470_01770 [Escherichia coli]|nr:hypothetical protein [Escherichia coli]
MKKQRLTALCLACLQSGKPDQEKLAGHNSIYSGAVSGMPAIRETGPGKNLQAITVSTAAARCVLDKAFTPHPARWR